jgi:hypothetical protein
MPNYRVVLLLGAVLLTSALLLRSFANHRTIECSPSMHDLRAMDLRGRWIVEITPDSAIQWPNVRLGRPLTGSFQLTSRDSSSSNVVYTGAYTADFQSVGLSKTTGEVLAFTPPGDTVRIILDPTVDHGNVELVAHCRSGGFAGTWIKNGDPSRVWGHFILRGQR